MNGAKKERKNLLLSVKWTQADSCNLFLPNL